MDNNKDKKTGMVYVFPPSTRSYQTGMLLMMLVVIGVIIYFAVRCAVSGNIGGIGADIIALLLLISFTVLQLRNIAKYNTIYSINGEIITISNTLTRKILKYNINDFNEAFHCDLTDTNTRMKRSLGQYVVLKTVKDEKRKKSVISYIDRGAIVLPDNLQTAAIVRMINKSEK